ncbi:MAG: proline--tRNA ligase, partial [Candidatus Brocadiae bacterium]|nr:proline--tRNA ligase [Candidatus Brocadiia bacterium]
GRDLAFGKGLFTLSDRKERKLALGPTHEEVITQLVSHNVQSYRDLPLLLYQIQTKFRDEIRPRFGVMRSREFIMKDAYSFSMDEAGLEDCYQKMREAYGRIFERCGLDYVVAEAESGAMGGEESHEFMVPASTGTGWFVQCAACGYAANVEKAGVPAPPEPEPLDYEPELREVETPGRTTIEQVSEFLGAPPDRMIKTIIYVADGEPVAALVRGDHEVNEAKLRQELNARTLEQAGPELIENLTGAPVGFAGPVGLDGVELVVDQAAARVQDAVTGANRADAHLVGVVPGRDFAAGRVADIRLVTAHERCPRCGEPIAVHQGIEVGHIFKLGTKYSSALGASFMDPGGANRPYVMGCYGIGI